MIKWIERIELITGSSNNEEVSKSLVNLLDKVTDSKSKESVKIYSHLALKNDFSVHIRHETDEIERNGSSLGLALFSNLKKYGMVNHNIWIEKSGSTEGEN